MITIYHNPHCSKSRQALELTQQFATTNGLSLHVIDYQKTPPTVAQLATLQQQLGEFAREMVRENEEEYVSLNLAQANNAALLKALADYPKLLQRPIVVYRNRAVIGRPSERLDDLLRPE